MSAADLGFRLRLPLSSPVLRCFLKHTHLLSPRLSLLVLLAGGAGNVTFFLEVQCLCISLILALQLKHPWEQKFTYFVIPTVLVTIHERELINVSSWINLAFYLNQSLELRVCYYTKLVRLIDQYFKKKTGKFNFYFLFGYILCSSYFFLYLIKYFKYI